MVVGDWVLRDKTPDALLMKKMKIWGKHYRNKKTGEDLMIGVFYPDADVNIPQGYEFQVFSKEQAMNGYPFNEVGITKQKAIKLAKEYMEAH